MIFIISTLVSKKMFVKEFKWAFTIIVMVVCFSQCEGIMRMGYVSEDYIRYDSYYSILQPFDELEKKVDFSSDTYEVVNDDIWNWRYYVPVEE